jgi:hypothetical protein
MVGGMGWLLKLDVGLSLSESERSTGVFALVAKVEWVELIWVNESRLNICDLNQLKT